MYVPSNTPKYVCYKCRNKIPVADLEKVFQEQLKGFVFSPEQIAAHLEDADKTIQEKQELLTVMEKEYQQVKAKMERIIRLYTEEHLTGEAVKRIYSPLETRAKQLETGGPPQIQGEVAFLRVNLQSSDQVYKDAQNLYGHWSDLSQEEKRNVVETIVNRITI